MKVKIAMLKMKYSWGKNGVVREAIRYYDPSIMNDAIAKREGSNLKYVTIDIPDSLEPRIDNRGAIIVKLNGTSMHLSTVLGHDNDGNPAIVYTDYTTGRQNVITLQLCKTE